jgi:hypothetical protein
MQESHLIVSLPLHLSDEAAYYFCEFFYEIARTLENRYESQLKSYYKKIELGRGRLYIPDPDEQDDYVPTDDEEQLF